MPDVEGTWADKLLVQSVRVQCLYVYNSNRCVQRKLVTTDHYS